MNKIIIVGILFLFAGINDIFSQDVPEREVFLLTCAPGTEVYSVYGHSALRIIDNAEGTDMVYNWGVFDFATKHFAWKFAKGRLSYSLGVSTFDRFMKDYFYEARSVYSQKVNLTSDEIEKLMSLIRVNLRPENVSYRYDFFYDDCSTRIRDLFERVTGNKLIYPPDELKNAPSYREMIGKYSRVYPWLKMGIDLLMGIPGDRRAFFRDRMFLPDYLELNLAQAVVNRDRKMVPLLQPVVTLLEFDPPEYRSHFYTNPMFIFSLFFIMLLGLSTGFRNRQFMNYIDILIFLCFSLLAVLMLFFNFFTDHLQTRINMNIIWFNPLIIVCLVCLVLNRECRIWFRAVFYLSVIFIPVMLIIPNRISFPLLPVILVLALRSAPRCDFSWYPLTKI